MVAIAFRALRRFFEPFLRRDLVRSNRLSFFKACFKARGFSKVVPSESVASVLMPRSTPIAVVAVGTGLLLLLFYLNEQTIASLFTETVALSILASVGI